MNTEETMNVQQQVIRTETLQKLIKRLESMRSKADNRFDDYSNGMRNGLSRSIEALNGVLRYPTTINH